MQILKFHGRSKSLDWSGKSRFRLKWRSFSYIPYVPAIVMLLVGLSTTVAASAQEQSDLVGEVDRTTLQIEETQNLIGPAIVISPHFYQPRSIRAGTLMLAQTSVAPARNIHPGQAISIYVDPGRIPTPPVEPGVNPPATQESGEPNFFGESLVDNPSPYLGQGIVYTFRFFQAGSFHEQPFYHPPDFAGFWSEMQIGQKQYSAEKDGRIYQVTEMSTVLYPISVGKITIKPASLTFPGDFSTPQQKISTASISVDVKALPGGAPADYNGAVGWYTIRTEFDSASVFVNEPVSMRVILDGQGNIYNLPDPIWPLVDGVRSYESQATINASTQDGLTTGNRTYERLLVPERAGEFLLPPIKYSFFDPIASKYHTIETEPISISAVEGKPETDNLGFNSIQDKGKISENIRPLKGEPDRLVKKHPLLPSQPIYWGMYVIPLAALAIHITLQRREKWQLENPELVQSSGAYATAIKSLKKKRNMGCDPSEYGKHILNSYLTDKFSQSVAGLTYDALKILLVKRGVSETLVEDVVKTLAFCEFLRFSPVTTTLSHSQELYDRIENLIAKLEKVL